MAFTDPGRVCAGGAFNLPRASYSEDTQQLLKLMMEECHLSMLKRRELGRLVKQGEPLPPLLAHQKKQAAAAPVMSISRPAVCRKRSRQAVLAMGAYERDTFPASRYKNTRSCEDEKRRLQSLMACGTEVPQNSDRAGRQPPRSLPQPRQAADRVEELVQEVRERCQFLHDVSELGQAERYRHLMQAEISSKIAAIRAIDPRRADELRRELRLSTAGHPETAHRPISTLR